jgi:hypothetical protein
VGNPEGVLICPHHLNLHSDEWAVANRTFCNFVHRGIEPPPVVVELAAESQEPTVVYDTAWA